MTFWTVIYFILLVVAAVVGTLAFLIIRNLARQRQVRAARYAEWQAEAPLRAAKERESKQRALMSFANEHVGKFRRLGLHLEQVSRSAKQAAGEFEQRAYGPFWDEILKALQSAAAFNAVVMSMSHQYGKDARGDWTEVREKYEMWSLQKNAPYPMPMEYRPRPPFRPLIDICSELTGYSASEIPDPSPALQELHLLIRKGQTDFQFATIYEQKKTQAILVQGFSSVTDAVSNMSTKMESSFTRLTATVQEGFDQVATGLESVRATQAAGNAAVARHLSSINNSLRLLHY